MKTFTPAELAAILTAHSEWLRTRLTDKPTGARANLSGSDLSGSDLSGSNLRGSDLSGSDLSGSNLRGSNLRYSNLSYSNLSGSDLSYSNLSGSDLSGSDLSGSNLSYSNLSYSNLTNAKIDYARAQIVPEYGPFYGYKKLADGGTALLLIPKDAGRVGGLLGRKCRAERARVVTLYAPDGTERPKGYTAVSLHDAEFSYKAGKTVTPNEWEPSPAVECAGGIHFFLTHTEAKEYN